MAKVVGIAALGALALTLPTSSAFTTSPSVGFSGRTAAAQSAASGRIPSIVLGAAHKGLQGPAKAPRGAARNGVTGASMAGYNIDLTGKVRPIPRPTRLFCWPPPFADPRHIPDILDTDGHPRRRLGNGGGVAGGGGMGRLYLSPRCLEARRHRGAAGYAQAGAGNSRQDTAADMSNPLIPRKGCGTYCEGVMERHGGLESALRR